MMVAMTSATNAKTWAAAQFLDSPGRATAMQRQAWVCTVEHAAMRPSRTGKLTQARTGR